MKQSPLISEFHLLFTLRIFSICHKTILPQQMHAVDIIITHLNIIQAFSMHAAPNVYSWIFTHDKREAVFTKKPIRSYIIHLKMHLYAVPPTSTPPILSGLSLLPLHSLMWEAALGTQPCHINMRTGETLPLLSPVLQSPRPAVEAAANDTRYGRSCQLVVLLTKVSKLVPLDVAAAGQNQTGPVIATCRWNSPSVQTTPSSATLQAPWILPRQGSMGAPVAMVPAKFGSNKREGNRRWAKEGEFVVARQRKGRSKGGSLCPIATLK